MDYFPPRLDLTPPDPRQQIAELCAEFPQHDLGDIVRVCRMVELRLAQLGREPSPPPLSGS
jgi:hypothetical protein